MESGRTGTAGYEALYLSDVMTGLIASLAMRGVRVLSKRGDQLDAAFERLYQDVECESAKHQLDVRFLIQRHPQHGDSEDVQEELVAAARRDLVSLDNPEFQIIRFKISKDDAPSFLEGLPGGSDLYQRLAEKFLQYYREATPSDA